MRRYLWPVTRSGNIRLLVWITGLWALGWLAYSFQEGFWLSIFAGVFGLLARSIIVLSRDGVDWLRQRSPTSESSIVHAQIPTRSSSPAADAVTEKSIFLCQGGTTLGPFGLDELRAKVASGEASSSDFVWRKGWAGWRRVVDVEECSILRQPPAAPTALPIPPRAAQLAAPSAQPTTIHLVLKYGTICFCGLLAFVLVLLLLTGGGNGNAPPAEVTAAQKPEPPPPPQPLTPEQIAERLRQSTVRIDAGFKVKGLLLDDVHAWLGSGVIFEKSREAYWILSNAHVVGSDSILNAKLFMDPTVLHYALLVTMPDGKQVRPIKVRINRHLKDFALIAVPLGAGNYQPLPANTARLPQGQKVFAMGHPQGLNGTFTSGVVSSWRSFQTRLGRDYEVIQTDATINAGNSGGPLVDDFARLVGINTFTMYRDQQAQGLNFAVAASEILRSVGAGDMVEFPLEPGRIGPFVKALNQGQYAR